MMFGTIMFSHIAEAMEEYGKALQQRLNNPNMEPLRRLVLQRKLDQHSAFLGALKGDLDSKSLMKLAEDAKEIDRAVFKGYTTPELGETPVQSLVKDMLAICKQQEEVDRRQVKINYVAVANDQGKIEAPLVDNMIEYTAIKEGNKNNREQFLSDYCRGLIVIEGKNLSHLNEAQVDQHLRVFLGINEPYPEKIRDAAKALQYQLILNTGQEVFEPFALDVNTKMKIEGKPAGFFVDCKASAMNWHQRDGKICLEVQYETKVLKLNDEEGQVVVKNSKGQLEKKDMESKLELHSRPSLVVHHYEAEIEVVLGKSPEARLNTTLYTVSCDPRIQHEPDMKNYHQVEATQVVVIGKNK